MGDPRKPRKKYEKPSHPYQKARIEEENKLVKSFGLTNKKEVWKATSIIRKFRLLARNLLGEKSEHKTAREKELIEKLQRLGLLKEGSTLDDVLSLNVTNLLDRRLQTIVFKKNLANTYKQARQLIVHGHIAINKKRITAPGYLVKVEEEDLIDYYGKKPELKPVERIKEKPVEKEPETKPKVMKAAPKISETEENQNE